MKMLVIENLKTGRAECGENKIPFPAQEILVDGEDFKTHQVESELLALCYLDRSLDLGLDNESNKKRVVRALELSNWVQKDAAKLLKITPQLTWDRIRKFNIIHPDGKWHQRGGRKPKLELKRKIA